MRYEVVPGLDWLSLPAAHRLDVAAYYTVPADSTDGVIIIPHGTPSWLRVRTGDLELLRGLAGRTLGELRAAPGFEQARPVLQQLYAAGLLFVNGVTGIRVEATASAVDEHTKPRSLLLKMTGACDMACSYCYDYDPVRWSEHLDLEFARHLISECLEPGQRLVLMFHGGEPLLRFTDIQALVAHAEQEAAARGADVGFMIQTNGLGLTTQVVDFLLAHRFGVGVSLDGPEQVHDLERIDHRGRGTFARLREKFDLFPRFMREHVGYISVATPRNLPHLEAMWEFFTEMEVRTWKLIPADPEGRGAGFVEDESFIGRFIDFIGERLDEVIGGRTGPPYFVNVAQLIEPFMSLRRNNMCMKIPCGAANDLLVLDAKSQLRGCDCSYSPAFLLEQNQTPLIQVSAGPTRSVTAPTGPPAGAGDRTSVGAALASPNARALHQRETWLLHEAECRSCTWLHYCAGTCPARALMRKGTLYAVDDLECSLRIKLFPRIVGDVSRQDSRLRLYFQRYAAQLGGASDHFTNL